MKLPLLILIALFQTAPAEPLGEPQNGEPLNLEATYQESVDAIGRGDWAAAIDGLNRILQTAPDHLPSRFYLAVSLNGAGDSDAAIAAYQDLLERDPGVFEARMNLGALLAQNDRPLEGAGQFALAMELAPANPTPAFYRGQILEQNDQVDPAMTAYREAIERAEAGTDTAEVLPHAYQRLGMLVRRTGGRNEDVRPLLTQALTLGIDGVEGLIALADMDVEDGNLADASGRYRAALDRSPGNEEIRWRLALVLRDLGEGEAALAMLEGLDRPEAIDVRADIFVALERYEDAIPIIMESAAADPANPDHWLALGQSYYGLGRFDEAIPVMDRVLELDPDRVEAWGTLAVIYYDREDWVNAGTMLLNYLEIEPAHTPSIFLLATCYDKLRDYEQALVHYNRFIQLDDGSDDARTFQVEQRARSLERLLEDN
jgi:tetratricopeptide (TPR) repeat protein